MVDNKSIERLEQIESEIQSLEILGKRLNMELRDVLNQITELTCESYQIISKS